MLWKTCIGRWCAGLSGCASWGRGGSLLPLVEFAHPPTHGFVRCWYGGNHHKREVFSFPRTCVNRWAPGNRTRIRTEPAPSELRKATGMQPCTGRAEPATAQSRVHGKAQQGGIGQHLSKRRFGLCRRIRGNARASIASAFLPQSADNLPLTERWKTVRIQ